MSTTTPLGFIVPVDADAPNGPLEIGGNAEKSDELFQKSGVAAHLFTEADTERTATTFGSLSTPLKVTLPRVLINQVIELFVQGFGQGEFKFAMNGVSVGAIGTLPAETEGKRQVLAASAAGLSTLIGAQTPEDPRGKFFSVSLGGTVGLYLVKETVTNFTVEVLAQKTSGGVVAKLKYGYLMAINRG